MAKILVVDDYRDTADTTAMWLKQIGHDVQIARDGYQAIELARRQRPHFVLLDIGLPGLDGVCGRRHAPSGTGRAAHHHCHHGLWRGR
jgi:DNA-binding response OmpR family regulator